MIGIYWNIYEILPYQRNFNLINGPRSIGKTYGTQKFLIDTCVNKGVEFMYIVRTQSEKKERYFEDSFKKVLLREFPKLSISTSIDDMMLEDDNRILGHCVALSEANKIKRKSYPNVKYFLFDEYMLAPKESDRYIRGWSEPDLFLSIYHTVDREEDRVICFLLGNNTNFYNPYHMHSAFNVRPINPGDLWTSENVLYQWAVPSEELKDSKAGSKFLRMINHTSYGNFAKDGQYIYDNHNFIEKMSVNAKYNMTLEYNGNSFGVFSDFKNGKIFISDKIDPYCKMVYALTMEDHKENTLLTQSKSMTHLGWLSKNFKLGNVRFVSMEVKTKCEKGIALIL